MRHRRGWLSLIVIAGAATAGVALACIIPDTDIYVFSLDENVSPVRFVEGIPLSEEAHCACNKSCECPLADQTSLPTFLDPNLDEYQFCICDENRIDENRLPGVLLFAEDQDEFDGEPTDELYAALLLDWSPTLGEPAFDYVAYRSVVDPRQELLRYFSSYETPIKRPRPWVRSINMTDSTGRFDLCNGAGKPLSKGFHTLTVIVTDQFWFQTSAGFSDTTESGDTGGPEPMGAVLDGVPNIAEGATYDIETYVFNCFEEGEEGCQCADATTP
ncbi:hypothetical protein ACNOYE_36555 [Nannocystaceae bacterium ST9]